MKVRCVNYCDDKRYYLRDGKIASADSFNENWAFDREATSFGKLHRDGLYQINRINSTMEKGELLSI